MKMSMWRIWVGLSCVVSIVWSVDAQAWNPLVLGGRCKQQGGACSSTIGNRGQGSGSCCDPADRNVLTCVAQNPCIGGRSYKWSTQSLPLSWWFNPNSMANKNGYAGLSTAQIEAALKKGWDAWKSPSCTAFSHHYRGQTTVVPSRRVDRRLVLYLASPQTWAQLGGGGSTLAFTMPIPNNQGELQDADIVYNPSPRGGWGVKSKIDIIGVTAHEVGHALGFAHAARTSSLMFYAHSGHFTSLPKDERNAICSTYPGACTVDADCGDCLGCKAGKCQRKSIPLARNLCKPCTKPADCGGIRDICIRLKEGQRCAQDCSNGGCCPVGYRCSDIGAGQMMCLPDVGSCPDIRCTSNAQCGPGEHCVSGGVCRPKPVPKDPKSCRVCSVDADCGGKNKCFSFPGGKKRCTQPCAVDNFCPTGYICRDAVGGRFCFPEDFTCTCSSKADCASDEICRSGVCRPSTCQYGCACSDKIKCDAPFQCFQTPSGSTCLQPCGGPSSGTFPKGVPGSACNNRQCSLGAQCFSLQSGGTICLKPCTSNASCTATGGRCMRLGSRSFCTCTASSQCLSQQACNQSVLGSNGGACAPKPSGSSCEPNFECRSAGSTKICLPKLIRKVWETCGPKLACKDGLRCLRTSSDPNSGVCFEDCSKNNTCSLGGACNMSLGNNLRACGCTQDSQCPSGKKCLKVFANGQLGYCGVPQFQCGDTKCDTVQRENCSNCPGDCPCAAGRTCVQGVCQVPSPRCGDGSCNGKENCATCAKDCPCAAGTTCRNNVCVKPAAPRCGDGTCNGKENCTTCAQDCGCTAGKTCQNGVCQTPPQSCGNGTCESEKGENCTACVQDCGCTAELVCQKGICSKPPQQCGNGTCEATLGENCGTCARDCACSSTLRCIQDRCQTPPKSCGNKKCEAALGENCGACAQDCGCPSALRCIQNRCQTPPKSCGNGTCEPQLGESCSACAQDCGCTSGKVCQNGVCRAVTPPDKSTLPCPVEDQLTECDEQGQKCKTVCSTGGPSKGCACNSSNSTTPTLPLFWMLLLSVYGWALRRRYVFKRHR